VFRSTVLLEDKFTRNQMYGRKQLLPVATDAPKAPATESEINEYHTGAQVQFNLDTPIDTIGD